MGGAEGLEHEVAHLQGGCTPAIRLMNLHELHASAGDIAQHFVQQTPRSHESHIPV
jgi:hypothetical protein